jgi:hypothetical protein
MGTAEKQQLAAAAGAGKPTSDSPPPPPSSSSSMVVGNAVVLLSNWESFGLCERSGLHFDWIDAILPAAASSSTALAPASVPDGASHKTDSNSTTTATTAPTPSSTFCGVAAVLECVPKDSKLRTDQRRKLKSELRQFNARSHRARIERTAPCFAPSALPMRLSFGSSVVFGYESTRIAFVVDASPTLTCTYGFGTDHTLLIDTDNDADVCCPLDRLVPMARTFFASLVQPVPVQSPIPNHREDRAASISSSSAWIPDIAVTVMAVFPRASVSTMSGSSNNSSLLLVRDYRVNDSASASLLVRKMEEWVTGPLEAEIASRLANPAAGFAAVAAGIAATTMPQHTSHLSDLLSAGDVMLSTLSSSARPVIVLATDARALSVESMMVDVATDPDRIDVPLVVLDVSSPESHTTNHPSSTLDLAHHDGGQQSGKQFHMLSYDPTGPAFPLFLSDDSEALYGICRATGGAFYDAQLLNEAARTIAGKVPVESPLFADHIFSSKRHAVRANAVRAHSNPHTYSFSSTFALSHSSFTAWDVMGATCISGPMVHSLLAVSALSRFSPPAREARAAEILTS